NVWCQTSVPASLTVQPGQRLTIRCQVSYSLGSWTAWIRQAAGKGLEWIGMKYTGNSYYKDSLKNKFSIDLDTSSKTVTLNGQNMQPEDSAVYYCARDTVIQTSSRAVQKPLRRRSSKTIFCGCLILPKEKNLTWVRHAAVEGLEWIENEIEMEIYITRVQLDTTFHLVQKLWSSGQFMLANITTSLFGQG
uniref:Ig-like domain-containing protein n=1 Tax=Cyprinodon variegatus TaxID=28743 RepID=A0A3Q2G7U9_CYPVA